jgi:ZIP family zinc transporter
LHENHKIDAQEAKKMKKEETKQFIRWYILGAIGAVLTILAAGIVVPALSYLLSFAAGAMLYVVVEELIPEMSQGQHSNVGTVFFAVGFSVMMVLDVALG